MCSVFTLKAIYGTGDFMNSRKLLVIAAFVLFLGIGQTVVNSQFQIDDERFYMVGTVGKDKKLSGYFIKGKTEFKDQNQFTFIASNGKVYKLSLTDKNVGELFIDGQKIAPADIEKHSAEYRPFVEKVLRSAEIEKELNELERKTNPLERRNAALDEEIEKLEAKLEEIEKKIEKGANGFTDNRDNLQAQIDRLSEMQDELDGQIDELDQKRDPLDEEQDALGLYNEMEKVLDQITADLKSLGVAKNTANLSYKLSNRELIVNGQKVSAEVFELLKTRYLFETATESGYLLHWKGKV